MKQMGFLKKVGKWVKQNSSTILSCISAAGVCGTVYLAIRDTPKALKAVSDAAEEKGEELTTLEKVQVSAPVYFPTALAGVSTICCIFGANHLNHKQQATLLSAYTMLDATYREYQDKVVQICGKDTNEHILNDIANDHYAYIADQGFAPVKSKKRKEIGASEEYLTWYEPTMKQFFQLPEKTVMEAEYELNREFVCHGSVTLEDFYNLLGVVYDSSEEEYTLDDWGWDTFARDWYLGGGNDMPWIDFEHNLVTSEDGSEFYRIEYSFRPELLSCN